MSNTTEKFLNALLTNDRLSAKRLFSESSSQMEPNTFVENVIVNSLEQMGVGWENGSIALSQIYMGGRICEDLVDEIINPAGSIRQNLPGAAIAVLNDHHMLGKRIVYSTLRANGFDVLDYGRMDVEQLIDQVEKDKIEFLLLSVLMLPSALLIKTVSEKLSDTCPDVKVIVGGAPFRFDTSLWKKVGAHAMCRTASEVVPVIKKLSGGVK